MNSVTMTRGKRTITLYTVLTAGWLAYEVRRDTTLQSGMRTTFTEMSVLGAESAKAALAAKVALYRAFGWTEVAR